MKQQKTGRLSLRGWFGRMLRQPPRGFYGQPSVYLSGGVMEIEHFCRVRALPGIRGRAVHRVWGRA